MRPAFVTPPESEDAVIFQMLAASTAMLVAPRDWPVHSEPVRSRLNALSAATSRSPVQSEEANSVLTVLLLPETTISPMMLGTPSKVSSRLDAASLSGALFTSARIVRPSTLPAERSTGPLSMIDPTPELWRKLGDDGLREAAYRGGY